MLPGYFPETYHASGYWADDYWPEYGVPVVVVTAPLLNAGYFPTTYFTRGLFEPHYWPEYGSEGTPAGTYPGARRYITEPRLSGQTRGYRDDRDVLELLTMFTGRVD